jgi:hypothetical protein
MKIKLWILILISMTVLGISACGGDDDPIDDDPIDDEIKGWDGESITYLPDDIAMMSAAIPQGYAIVNPDDDQSAIIKSLSPELDNYGGIATDVLTLDFNHAVIFRMDVVSAYTQYIVKLFVEGETDAFYVLSDEGTPGVVSVNVIDAMLSDKYREKGTQPDPGYDTGFKYDGEIKNCYFYIMPKGPDGEQRTAELIVRSISVTNYKTPAITGVDLSSPEIVDGTLSRLKGSAPVTLEASAVPSDAYDASVTWSSADPSVATVTADGEVSFVGVGITTVTATSVVDQSKTGDVVVDVRSGYENPSDLTDALEAIDFTGGPVPEDQSPFEDLYRTTWTDGPIIQNIRVHPSDDAREALRSYGASEGLLVENRFDPSISGHASEADQSRQGDYAMTTIQLAGNNVSYGTRASVTLYRNIGGLIHKESLPSGTDLSVHFRYAAHDAGAWSRLASYSEETIAVFADGTVTKYRINVKNVTVIAEYTAQDFLDPTQWADGDTLVLAPGSVRDNGDGTVTIREENPTSYPYGGIVSTRFDGLDKRTVEIALDVTGLNPERVLWNIRLVYYNNGNRVGNPLNLQAGNDTGRFTPSFIPAFTSLRIYLIANGSDISVIAPGAEIKIRSLTFQYIDD